LYDRVEAFAVFKDVTFFALFYIFFASVFSAAYPVTTPNVVRVISSRLAIFGFAFTIATEIVCNHLMGFDAFWFVVY
ncbi:MAG: hypothetical protein ACRDK2_01110, partial [Solirubrobacteraceae bacterium]